MRYAELRAKHAGEVVPPVWLESNELSCLLYTPGTTAKPKGIPRDTGGHAVALTLAMRYIFAGVPGDTMFTSPTAIRVLKRQDPALLRRHDTSCLQRLFPAGEPLPSHLHFTAAG